MTLLCGVPNVKLIPSCRRRHWNDGLTPRLPPRPAGYVPPAVGGKHVARRLGLIAGPDSRRAEPDNASALEADCDGPTALGDRFPTMADRIKPDALEAARDGPTVAGDMLPGG